MIEPNPWQGRVVFDPHELETLAQSIKIHGLQQPPTGRMHPEKPGKKQLVTGKRRVRACKNLGWKKIPMIIRNVSDRQMLTENLVENIERKDINAIEEARQYKRLEEEFGYTHIMIAEERAHNENIRAHLDQSLVNARALKRSLILTSIHQ